MVQDGLRLYDNVIISVSVSSIADRMVQELAQAHSAIVAQQDQLAEALAELAETRAALELAEGELNEVIGYAHGLANSMALWRNVAIIFMIIAVIFLVA
ncbi:MAG: hypothetical protein CUN55_20055 [Phototrophicales bacterium]|nr:MAG: hypothetical protein CUN55_20055 [Phototrophicales bacterium]